MLFWIICFLVTLVALCAARFIFTRELRNLRRRSRELYAFTTPRISNICELRQALAERAEVRALYDHEDQSASRRIREIGERSTSWTQAKP